MNKIINGKAIALQLQDSIKTRLTPLAEKFGRVPHLVVIIVGEDPASQVYVRNKALACERVGFKNTTLRLSEDIEEATLLNQIRKLNEDECVDGILVQLPLPKHLNETKVIDTIAHSKDVDGFHPQNTASLWQKRPNCNYVAPCTPKGVMHLLRESNVELAGKSAVVLGRSQIVGLPMAKLLLDANATVTICHSRTKNLAFYTRQADIVVVAIGLAKYLKGDMIKEGATVIDVGMDRDPETNALCGDVDFDEALDKVSLITPVPGGVGPMTIACLLENTLDCYLNKMNAQSE